MGERERAYYEAKFVVERAALVYGLTHNELRPDEAFYMTHALVVRAHDLGLVPEDGGAR